MKGTVVKEDETFVEKYHCSLLNFTIEQTGLINYLILFSLFLSALTFHSLISTKINCYGLYRSHPYNCGSENYEML